MPTSPDDPSIRPWKAREPVDHRRLNAHQERTITDITVGPGLKILRKGNQAVIGLQDRPRTISATFLTVKITANVVVGVYSARSYKEPGGTPGGALIESQLGALATEDDCFVWDPESIGLGTALPLNGLITRGEIVAYDTAGTELPIVLIPPPGIRDVRYNTSTDKLQVAYVSNPTESDWVDKITFTTCE